MNKDICAQSDILRFVNIYRYSVLTTVWEVVTGNEFHPFQYKICSIPILDFLAPICRSNGRCWIRGGTCPPRPKEDFCVEIPSNQNHGILGITLCILGGSNMDHFHYRYMVIAVP